MRILGIDVGRRRVGLAISDPSCTLARPLATLTIEGESAVERVAREVERLAAEEDGLDAVVVGCRSRLDGSPTDRNARGDARFIDRLRTRISDSRSRRKTNG